MATFIPTKTIKLKPRFGMPAGSVRLKYSLGQKKRVLEALRLHLDIYMSNEEWFYSDNLKPIGHDKTRKTTNTIFTEIKDKLPVWEQSRNDIQESYILRNNFVTEQAAIKQFKLGTPTKLIDDYINATYIVYNDVEPKLYTQKPIIDLFE